MKTQVTLEKEDIDHMHDVVYEVIMRTPSDEEIVRVWNALPERIQATAIHWGCSDTVFRDKMYEWLSENLREVNLP